jgi:MFS family permease
VGADAGAVLGTALAIKMVAYVGIAPLVGGFAHRLPRRGLLIALDLARAGFVACLPFVSEVWHVYVLIFLLNACSAGFTPTFQATIPDVLPDEARYTRALSLSRLAYDLENLLSPTLAAAALLLPRLLDRVADRKAMLAGGALLALSLAAGFAGPGFVALLPVWFVLGAGASLIQTPSGRLLRRSAQAGDRPALFSAQFALSHACWLVAYPLAGWLGSVVGLDTAFAALAVLAVAATAVAALLWPRDDPVVLHHRHEAMDHEHLHVHDQHHDHAHEGWEGPEPHRHPHGHRAAAHSHDFVIDAHHRRWPWPSAGWPA